MADADTGTPESQLSTFILVFYGTSMGKTGNKIPIEPEKANEHGNVQADPSGKTKAIVVGLSTPGDLHLDEGHWNKRSRIKWTVTLFMGAFLVYAARTSMSVAVTSISIELGWNKEVSGMVLSSFFAGYVTTNILGGYLADKYGGEKVMLYGAFVWITMTALLPIFARYPGFFLFSNTYGVVFARFLTGVGQGMHFPSMTSIVTRRNTVKERPFVWGTAISGSAVGTIFSGLAGSFLIEIFGWPSYFFAIGLLSYAWSYFLRVSANSIAQNDAKSASKIKKPLPTREPVPWLLLFSRIETWALLVVYFCNNLCFYNLLSWLPIYFHENFPNSKGWVFNVIPWVASFLVSMSSGFIARKLIISNYSVTFVRKLCTALALYGGGIFLLLLDFAETFMQALFLMTLVLGIMAFTNVGPIQNSQDLAPKYAGALYGVMNSFGAFSGIIGVYVSGYLLEVVGKWSAVFHLSSGACFLGCTVFLLFGSGERIV